MNEQFRAARERTASPSFPDVCLSRQELAELVNAWVWEHHNKKIVAASANWIGQIERGKIRWPGKVYREAFRAILGVPTDTALGFVNTRRAVVKLDNVNRKKFLHAATGLSVGTLTLGPVAALLEGTERTPVPTRVGATEIEQVRAAATVFSGWDFTYGGGVARDAVMGQLHWSAGLLEATCPARLRPKLFSAVGDLAHRAGFMAFDAGAYEDAHQVLSFALACAKEAEDWDLHAYVLDSLALLAMWTGHPDEALTQTEGGLIRPDRLTETVQAMLHTDRARALATMRRVDEALAAVGAAEGHFAHFTPANDPPFLANYNAAFLAGNTGHALFDLAMLGHSLAPATDRLTAAAAGHTASHARPRAICLTKLASLTMATDDPIHAATLAHTALDVAGTVRSRRVTDYLRELFRYASPHQHLDEVAHLRHRIATLVCTDHP